MAETDARRREDYGGLAPLFAEAAGCRAAWKQALQGWNMIQSQQVLEWMAEREAKGKVEGKVEGKAETLLRILRLRFGSMPADLTAAIRASTDLAQLDGWVDAAVTSGSLADFRQATQL